MFYVELKKKVAKSAWNKEEEDGEGCELMADGRESTRMGHLSNEYSKRRDWNVQRPCGRKELPML